MSGQYKTEWDALFIGGKWTEPSTDQVIDVHSPATGEYVGRVPMAAAADVDAAVAAARAAFDTGPLLASAGMTLPLGPTGTNLADVHVLARAPA